MDSVAGGGVVINELWLRGEGEESMLPCGGLISVQEMKLRPSQSEERQYSVKRRG